MPRCVVSLIGINGSSGGGFNPVLITTDSLPSAAVGISYNVTFSVIGGFPPYVWSVSAGALPPGLSLSSDGVISGIPTAAGNFAFTILVVDGVGQSDNISGRM